MENSVTYSFVYRVLTASQGQIPYLALKTGSKEELFKAVDMGNDYFITRVKLPIEFIKGEVFFGVQVKSAKTGTYYLYQNLYHQLEACHLDTFVTVDLDHRPLYTPLLTPWIQSTGLIMHSRALDAFTFDIAKGPRFEFGVNQCLAMIQSPFLSHMLRWGTSKGKYIAPYPQKLSKKFLDYAAHYREILEDSKQKYVEEQRQALQEQLAQEKGPQRTSVLIRVRKFFSRLARRH